MRAVAAMGCESHEDGQEGGRRCVRCGAQGPWIPLHQWDRQLGMCWEHYLKHMAACEDSLKRSCASYRRYSAETGDPGGTRKAERMEAEFEAELQGELTLSDPAAKDRLLGFDQSKYSAWRRNTDGEGP